MRVDRRLGQGCETVTRIFHHEEVPLFVSLVTTVPEFYDRRNTDGALKTAEDRVFPFQFSGPGTLDYDRAIVTLPGRSKYACCGSLIQQRLPSI